MAKTDFKSVDAYIAVQPEERRATLTQVRAIIRRALPMAEETISYQIPAYKMPGGTVVYFAGWKEHFSLYPVSEETVADLEIDLARYTFSKGTMRFRLDARVPAGLITRIVKVRARQVAGAAVAKQSAKKKR